MDPTTSRQVWERARGLCEYCGLPQRCSAVPFEIDHIVAKKHGGLTRLDNLALSCFYCNSHKGPNIAGIDPASNAVARLFHPRLDRWLDHFFWTGVELAGRTPVGRATVCVLAINRAEFLALRRALKEEGRFPFAGQ